MKVTRTIAISLTLSLSAGVAAQSVEEASDACAEAVRLIDADDIDGALEEARWCVEGLEQLKQQQTLAVFPDSVDGYEGGELSNNAAMGMSMIERSYSRGDETIDVALTTGSLGGNLGSLAQLALGMGGAGRKLRVQKRTVIDMSESEGKASYMVQLKSGGMLTIGSDKLSAEAVLPFLKAFPIAEIDDAMSP